MVFPNTNTLDIASRGTPSYVYDLLNRQSIDTSALDFVSQGTPAEFIYTAINLRTLAFQTTLSRANQTTIATTANLHASGSGTIPLLSNFEKVLHPSIAILSTFESLGLYVPPISKSINTTYLDNSGGSIITTISTPLKTNQVLVVRYVGSDTQGDAINMIYGGQELTELVREGGAGVQTTSIWALFNPPVGTFDLSINTPSGGSYTRVAIDLFYNVKQSLSLVSAHSSGNDSYPNTNRLDVASRATPLSMMYDLQHQMSINTGLLDLPARSITEVPIYVSPATGESSSMNITPLTADAYIIDVFDSNAVPTPNLTSDSITNSSGFSHTQQVGGPSLQNISWSLDKGGLWKNAAIALEKALNNQNTLSLQSTLSKPLVSTLGMLARLASSPVKTLAFKSVFESRYLNDLAPATPMGLLIPLMYRLPDSLALFTDLEILLRPPANIGARHGVGILRKIFNVEVQDD